MRHLIQQANPHATYIEYKKEIDEAINKVLNSGWYILGEENASFEKEFSLWCGIKNTIGTGSGTDALVLALQTLNIGQGDIVLTVSHTAVATIAAIEIVGAIPYLIDIDPIKYTISPPKIREALEKLITNKQYDIKKVKAIIPVHIYGNPADMTSIMKIAEEYQLFVIEDCAQAHGAIFDNKKVGTFGHIAEFSFYPTKNLGAFGDGGALITDDDKLYKKAKALREYGWSEHRYVSDFPGMNTRLDELQAAVLGVKLKYLEKDNEKRRRIAAIYSENLKSVIIPQVELKAEHVYHQYVIRVKDRDELQKYLNSYNIKTAVHYPVPVHLQKAYSGRILKSDLKNTELIMSEILSLPIYSQLEIDDVNYICTKIEEFYKR